MKNLLSGLSASVLALSFAFAPTLPASAGEIVIPKPAVAQSDSQAEQVVYVRRHVVVRRGPLGVRRGVVVRRGVAVGGWHGARMVRRGPFWHGFRGYRTFHPGYRLYNGWWFPAAAFATGGFVGGTYGITAPAYANTNARVQWCASRYRSYRAWDNTFQPLNGPRRQCVTPF